MRKTPASKAPHRFVGISLLLIIFSSFSSNSIASMQEKQNISKMVQSSDLIIRGKVISTESQWKEDSRGRHIYTSVRVEILDEIKGKIRGKTKGRTKGKIKGGVFAFEVVGGTVDDIREFVSDTPVFEVGEDAIVFLGGYPLVIQGGINGKLVIYDGKVYWDGLEATVDDFIQVLKILKRDPGAKVSLGEESKAPTSKVTGGECFIYKGLRWFGASPVVDYKINENTSDCVGEGVAVQSAAEMWNNACDMVNFRLDYDGSHSSTTPSQNGVNEIMWSEIWSGSSSALARAYGWWIHETGEILEFDVVFNDNFSWSTSPSSSQFDVESVGLHEFGHWLLLDDLYDPADSDNVMYGYTSSGTEQRLLRQCDIDGLCYIYGCAGYCGGGNPVGWWRFDDSDTPLTAENSGSFGSSHNGMLDNMTASDWVSGVRGTALELDGEDDYVWIPALNLDSDTVTISAWIKRNGDQAGSDTGIVFSRDGSTVAGLCFGHDEGWIANHHLGYNWNDDHAAWDWDSGLFIPDNQWFFVALVVEPTRATLYTGENMALSLATRVLDHDMEEFDGFTFIGSDGLWNGRFFRGSIDDVRIYDGALSAEEILQIYRVGFGVRRASNPDPADGATRISTNAVLSWDAGTDAVSHDVYIGTNYNDVEHATIAVPLGVYQGNQSSTSYIPTLANDTTYYWRIDEVEGLNTWRGDVWSFKTWVEPNLVSWWRFDEAQGYTAYDSAGNNDGAVYGAQWAGGQIGGALEFDGEDDYVETADSPELDITEGITIGMWIKPYPGMDCDERGNWRYLLRKAWGWGAYNLIYEASWDVPKIGFTVVTGSTDYRLWTNRAAYPGEFTYLAFTYDAETGEQKTYFNGDLDSQQVTGGGFISNNSEPLRIGGGINTGCPDGAGYFKGLIDEVRIYDRALSAAEILQSYREGFRASNPRPADGVTGIAPDAVLSWDAGTDAVSHDVYIGTNYNDVVHATIAVPLGVYQGSQSSTSYIPTLAKDTTYYWRIDEVEGLNTWRGDVWRFKTWVEPNLVSWWRFDEGQGYTAYDSAGNNDGAVYGAQWAGGQIGALEFDGEDDYVEVAYSPGLDITDGITIGMWIKPYPGMNCDENNNWRYLLYKRGWDLYDWLSYDLIYGASWDVPLIGFHVVTGSAYHWLCTDSAAYPGEFTYLAFSYDAETGEQKTYFNGNLDSQQITGGGFIGTTNGPLRIGGGENRGCPDGEGYFKGLIDEVRIYDGALSAAEILQLYRNSFYVRRASNPRPADGATGISPDVVLSWDAGIEAVSHDVYIGTNYNDVEDATTSVPLGVYQGSQSSTSYISTLAKDTTYYWRIDEVEGPNTWRGDVWRFKTWVEPNLVSWWSFDEGQGYRASDSAGNNDGTVYGAQWRGGQIGGALEFDGEDDYVEVADSPGLDITEGITIGMWIKPYPGMDCDERGNWRYLLRKGKAGWGAYNLIYEASWDVPSIGFTVWTGSAYRLWTNRAVYPDEFTYLAFTYDSETAEQKTYFNGNLDSQQITGGGFIGNRSGPLRIGGGVNTGCPDGAGFFKGLIDEVRIYDRALSAAEILQLASFNTPPIACIAGGDRLVEAGKDCEAVVVLDGSCSSDADSTSGTHDDINDFDWYVIDSCNPNYKDYLGSGEVIECNLPLGENIIVLEVTDTAGEFDSNEVTITVEDVTGPEIILTGPDMIILECGLDNYSEEGATATDNCDGGVEVIIGGDTVDTASCGTYIISYDAADSSGNQAEQVVRVVIVEDTIGPEFSLAVEPNLLWPANHKMVLITVEWEVSDNCDDEPEVRLVSITSSEDDDGKGDGATSDDIVIGEDGSIYLRAERVGYLEGRVYTITYEAVDDSGNATVRSAEVVVPDGYRLRHRERITTIRRGSRGILLNSLLDDLPSPEVRRI